MSFKTAGRTVEKALLRPILRRIKRWAQCSAAEERLALFEERIERLESLFREQAGLHYLRLDEEPTAAADAERREPCTRWTA